MFSFAWKTILTFFLNCLWIASNASLIVTPFRFRAVTSSPSGKCRSIFLTGGVVKNFFKASFSSTVEGDVLSFLRELLLMIDLYLCVQQAIE